MKNKYLILTIAIIIFTVELSSSQNLPIRFKSFNKQRNSQITLSSQDTAELHVQVKKSFLDSDGIFSDTIFYKKLISSISDLSKKREDEIKNKYNLLRINILNQIQASSNSDDIKKLKFELEIITSKEEEELLEITYYDKLKKEYEYYLRTNNKFTFFCVHNSIDAQLFYNSQINDKKAQFLKNTNFVYNTSGEKISIMTEIYADYFGPFRVSLGALVSNKDTKIYIDSIGQKTIDTISTQKDAVQRILGGGGNVILTGSYPIFNYATSNKNFAIKGIFTPKFSLDVPIIGTETNEYGFNSDIGFDFSIYYSGILNNLTIFSYIRPSYIIGNNIFYQNLLKQDKDPFFLGQFTIGIALNSTFRISSTIYFGNDFVKNNLNSVVSFSIIPD